jgi:hypothetical protein
LVSPTTMEPVLEGMPEPGSLRLLTHEGEVVVLAGRWPRSFTLIHDSMIVWISEHDRHS